ncbi:MAG: urease accessory protein UreD [Alphaproteobacteria bacterium]|nr:urease accessory protein UreD [Alphaproteobacteria bacterium]
MNVAIAQGLGLAAPQRGDGAADLSFVAADGVTRLGRLYQRAPCRVLFPRPEPDEPMTAVTITTSGGIAGGDRLSIAIAAESGAQALVASQAAEKIYRSDGSVARLRVEIAVAPGAALEYLPQDTILFDRARLERETELAIEPGGRLLACDMVVFGRRARGERFDDGEFRDRWTLNRAGRMAWAERGRIAGGDRAFDHPGGLGGAAAMALVLYAGEDAEAGLDPARVLIERAGVRGGATLMGDLLLARLFDPDPARLRLALADLVAGLRAALLGRPARPPRLWQC